MTEDNVGFNSAYVSLNLLDELDYVIGGYGKPKIEFLFSLNTFVESFIASSNFYTSLDELNHLNLTAPAIFPNGRPILNMLVKAGGLKFVNGVIDKPNRKSIEETCMIKLEKKHNKSSLYLMDSL